MPMECICQHFRKIVNWLNGFSWFFLLYAKTFEKCTMHNAQLLHVAYRLRNMIEIQLFAIKLRCNEKSICITLLRYWSLTSSTITYILSVCIYFSFAVYRITHVLLYWYFVRWLNAAHSSVVQRKSHLIVHNETTRLLTPYIRHDNCIYYTYISRL